MMLAKLISRLIALGAAGAGLFLLFTVFTVDLGPARWSVPIVVMTMLSAVAIGYAVYLVIIAPFERRDLKEGTNKAQVAKVSSIPWATLGDELRLSFTLRMAKVIMALRPKPEPEAIETVPVTVTVMSE
jgi:hypothetical protein